MTVCIRHQWTVEVKPDTNEIDYWYCENCGERQ